MSERFAHANARLRKATVVVCLLTAGVHRAMGQTADPSPDAAPPAPPAPTAPAQPVYTPLTSDERLHAYVRSLAGPMALATGGVSAAWGQWRHRPSEWRLGAEGYGIRYGSGYAQRIARETLTYGASSLLHEDNRY